MAYKGISDFRSDTVTRPKEGMMRAMALAEVGDDVLGDDPTVRRLEERAAEILGKQVALFVPSGTQGNAIAIKVWTEEGDEVIVEERSHIYNFESGHLAFISRVIPRPLPSKMGEIPLDRLERVLSKRRDIHIPPPTLIALENTHNFWSGKVLSLNYMESVYKLVKEYGIKVHLDGARLWNAAAYLGVNESEIARFADSVMCCFSKGLGAPIGSILAGPKDFIEEARRIRKMLGGGMRQVGLLAACALYALENNKERLVEDHRRARKIAEAFSETKGLEVNLEAVDTNIVFVKVLPPKSANEWVDFLKCNGVLAIALSNDTVRFVTHLDVDDRDVEKLISMTKRFFES